MSKYTFKGMWEVLKNAGAGFFKHKVFKLSASLAYYTIFSIGPMLIVMIFVAKLFLGRQAVEGSLHTQISELVGNDVALQIQDIIKNATVSGNNVVAIMGIITLLIAATTVFTEMQDSINMIWNLKVRSKQGWLRTLKSRLQSFSIVASLGFLLLVTLVINGVLEKFMGQLQDLFPGVAFVIVYIVNLLVTLLVVSFLFGIIYKVLPDAVISWKDVFAGSVFTALLFMIGKFAIGLYISTSDMGSTYGSAGSLVVLLLWVYYSSMILYYGAEFTKAFALKYGAEIRPKDYAVMIKVVQVESKEVSVQQNEKKAADTEKVLQRHESKKANTSSVQ